jgi:hypothetical protein
MIVDFQHHFMPRELAQEPAGTKTAIRGQKILSGNTGLLLKRP